MNWTNDTPVILYGAAAVGSKACDYLSSFCNLIAFIDKRADEIKAFKGLHVVKVDSNYIPDETKKNAIVIVSVKNIFDHENIAQLLLSYGYENIVFCPVDGSSFTYRSIDEREQLAKIYENITRANLKLPINIPHSCGLFKLNFCDSAFIKKSDNLLTVLIPTFFAYNRLVAVQDGSLLTLASHLELFDWFSGNINSSPALYDEFCVDAAKPEGINITERWIQNVHDNRREVYEKMRMAEETDPMFFLDHAVPASWNENGYFNMQSGKHRAAYAIQRRKILIPLRITESDYKKYLNMRTVDEIISYITKQNLTLLQYPIFHPYFLRMSFEPSHNYVELLYSFTRWLSVCVYNDIKKKDLKGLSFLDTTGILYPLLQCLCKLGCSAEFSYPVNEFDTLVNRLYHISSPPVKTDNTCKKYDVIFAKYNEGETVLCNNANYYCLLFKDKNQIPQAEEKLNIKLTPLRWYKGFVHAGVNMRLVAENGNK